MKLTNAEQKILERMNIRLDRCLEKYREDNEEGKKWMILLICSYQAKSLLHLRKLKPTRIKNDHKISKIVRRITELYSLRLKKNIEQSLRAWNHISQYCGGKLTKNKFNALQDIKEEK